MKALTLAAAGGIEQLRVQELPEPAIQSADDVLVRVQAAALNRLDLFVAAGLPGANLTFPHVVGSDAAGVVEQVGSAVRQLATARPQSDTSSSVGAAWLAALFIAYLCPISSFRLARWRRAPRSGPSSARMGH